MTRMTQTRAMRNFFGAKQGKRYDSLPLDKKICAVCLKDMMVADGTIAKFHGCCRPFRNNAFSAHAHIEQEHA